MQRKLVSHPEVHVVSGYLILLFITPKRHMWPCTYLHQSEHPHNLFIIKVLMWWLDLDPGGGDYVALIFSFTSLC